MGFGWKSAQEIVTATMDYCVDRALKCFRDDKCSRAQANVAVDWLYIAISLAWCVNPGYLRSIKIEHLLSKIALSAIGLCTVGRNISATRRKHVVHVATSVSLRGGHTRVIARWIDSCRMFDKEQVHHLVLTCQGKSSIPEWLLNSVSESGGDCISISRSLSWVEKSEQLREFTKTRASIVVLHVHPNDPIANLAFSGMRDFIPVYFFNHADHVFSITAGVCGRVLDFRKSGQDISSRYRGAESLITPLPMVVEDIKENFDRKNIRSEARARLNISPDVFVALTIGDEYKYKEALGYSFIQCITKLLELEPCLMLIAVGIPNTNEWADLASKFQNRFVPTGIVFDKCTLNSYYSAADIYLEGFPFSSLTALIDAGLNALPVQRMLNVNLPILSGDDIALDGLIAVATNCEEYIVGTRGFLQMNIEQRESLGFAIRDSIVLNHCGKSWIENYIDPLFCFPVLKKKFPSDGLLYVDNEIIQDHVLEDLACFQWETKGAFSVTILSLSRSPLSLFRWFAVVIFVISKNFGNFTIKQNIAVLLSPLVLFTLRYSPIKMFTRVRNMLRH